MSKRLRLLSELPTIIKADHTTVRVRQKQSKRARETELKMDENGEFDEVDTHVKRSDWQGAVGYYSESMTFSKLCDTINSVSGCDEVFSGGATYRRLVFDIDEIETYHIGHKVVTNLIKIVNGLIFELTGQSETRYSVYHREKADYTNSYHVHELMNCFCPNKHSGYGVSNKFNDKFMKPFAQIVFDKLNLLRLGGNIDMKIYTKNHTLRMPHKNKIKTNEEAYMTLDKRLSTPLDCDDYHPYRIMSTVQSCLITAQNPFNKSFNRKGYSDSNFRYHHVTFMTKLDQIHNKLNPIVNYIYKLPEDIRRTNKILKTGDSLYDSDNEEEDGEITHSEGELEKLIKEKTAIDFTVKKAGNRINVTIDNRKHLCPCCDSPQPHSSQNWYIMRKSNGAISFGCYSQHATITLVEGDKNYVDYRAMNYCISLAHKPDSIPINTEWLTTFPEGESEHLDTFYEDLYDKTKHYGIRSPMGTGKSTFSFSAIRRAFMQDLKVIVVAPLKVLTRQLSIKTIIEVTQLSRRGRRISVGLYADIREKNIPNDYDVLIITPESLHRVGNNVYDVAIYDEITTIFANLAGKTLQTGIARFFKTVRHIQSNCMRSLMIDAHLEKHSEEIVPNTTEKSFFVNEFPFNMGTYQILEKNTSITAIKEDIINGYRIVIACNSKKRVQRNQKSIIDFNEYNIKYGRDIRILYVYAATRCAHLEVLCQELGLLQCLEQVNGKQFFRTKQLEEEIKKHDYYKQEKEYCEKLIMISKNADNEEFWNQYDVIMHSPSIMVGLDFNNHGVHRVYGLFSATSINFQQATQMTQRFRQVKKFSFEVTKGRGSYVGNFTAEQVAKIPDYKMSMFLGITYSDYMELTVNEKLILRLEFAKKNASVADFRNLFFMTIEQQGIKFVENNHNFIKGELSEIDSENVIKLVDDVKDRFDNKDKLKKILDNIASFNSQIAANASGVGKMVTYLRSDDSFKRKIVESMTDDMMIGIYILEVLYGKRLEEIGQYESQIDVALDTYVRKERLNDKLTHFLNYNTHPCWKSLNKYLLSNSGVVKDYTVNDVLQAFLTVTRLKTFNGKGAASFYMKLGTVTVTGYQVDDNYKDTFKSLKYNKNKSGSGLIVERAWCLDMDDLVKV